MAGPDDMICGVTCTQLKASERHTCDLPPIVSSEAGRHKAGAVRRGIAAVVTGGVGGLEAGGVGCREAGPLGVLWGELLGVTAGRAMGLITGAGCAAGAPDSGVRADVDFGAPCWRVCGGNFLLAGVGGGDFLGAGLGGAGLTCRYLARICPMPADSSCSDAWPCELPGKRWPSDRLHPDLWIRWQGSPRTQGRTWEAAGTWKSKPRKLRRSSSCLTITSCSRQMQPDARQKAKPTF